MRSKRESIEIMVDILNILKTPTTMTPIYREVGINYATLKRFMDEAYRRGLVEVKYPADPVYDGRITLQITPLGIEYIKNVEKVILFK